MVIPMIRNINTRRIRYPKVNNTKPIVHLQVMYLLAVVRTCIELPAPTKAVSEDHILAKVNWIRQDVGMIQMNRRQNV